jgi:hypothetical protein
MVCGGYLVKSDVRVLVMDVRRSWIGDGRVGWGGGAFSLFWEDSLGDEEGGLVVEVEVEGLEGVGKESCMIWRWGVSL